ncbi:hypothetical protein MTO96_041573 [Rhipicephalus appendiculatus]
MSDQWFLVFIPLKAFLICRFFVECTRQPDGFTIEAYVVVDSVNVILSQLPGSLVITGFHATRAGYDPYMKPKRGCDLICTTTSAQAFYYTVKTNINIMADVVLVFIGPNMYCYRGGRQVVVHGITAVGSACNRRNVVVITGNREFKSVVLTTAHELGHALGASHDGTGTSKGCSANERHIMAPSLGLERKSTFSSCSKRVIGRFLSSNAAGCLWSRRCPGALIPEDEQQQMRNDQCLRKVKETEDFLNATVMYGCILSCYVRLFATYEVTSFETSAPDWTSCKENQECKVCIKGLCV